MPDTPTVLLLCDSCTRHFRPRELSCPFCGTRVLATARRAQTPKAPPTGASRAQRYAARAALIASSAGLACSSSTPMKDEGQAGTTVVMQGGQGGGAQAGTTVLTGGGGTGAGAGAGTLAGSGGQSGSGGMLAGGTGSMSPMACPGAIDPSGSQMSCRIGTDCPGGLFRCVTQPPSSGCGNPTFQPRECEPTTVATDCGADSRCVVDPCGATTCVANCTSSSCAGTENCVDGSCVAKRCDEAGAAPCAEDFACAPADGASDIRGCAPVPCDSGDDCELNRDCSPGAALADARGCAKRPCMIDEQCDCGYCVNRFCEATLGFCFEELAMPYGTVWPDEELV